MTIESSHVGSFYPHQINFKENHNQDLVIVLRDVGNGVLTVTSF